MGDEDFLLVSRCVYNELLPIFVDDKVDHMARFGMEVVETFYFVWLGRSVDGNGGSRFTTQGAMFSTHFRALLFLGYLYFGCKWIDLGLILCVL